MKFYYSEQQHLTRNNHLVNMWRAPVKDDVGNLIGMIHVNNLGGVSIKKVLSTFRSSGEDVISGSDLEDLLFKINALVHDLGLLIVRTLRVEYIKH